MLAEKTRVEALLESMPLPTTLANMYAPPQEGELAQSEAYAAPAASSATTPCSEQFLAEEVVARQHKFVVGLGHMIGYDVRIDYPFGLACLQQASSDGCVAAQAAMCLDDDSVLVRHRAFSVLLAISNSETGYSHALCFTCKCLCAKACELGLVKMPTGYDVAKEYETAMLSGFAVGSFLCGCMYIRQECHALAYMCFQEAMKGGVALAHLMLATCLWNGLGVPVDVVASMRHARNAHEYGSRRGTFLYACILLDADTTTNVEQRRNSQSHAFTLLQQLATKYDTCQTEETYMRCTYLRGKKTCPNPHHRLYECHRDGVGTQMDGDLAAVHLSKV